MHIKKKVRAKAPLRLGIAGGGTDLSPYSDIHSGAVLNATISLYSHTTLENRAGKTVFFNARDLDVTEEIPLDQVDLSNRSGLLLHRAVYLRVMQQFNHGVQIPVEISTYCDAPPGSGLGSSSALVVSMLEAYREMLSLPLGEYDIARLAYEIERVDCGLAGGKQDQYAAAFGGFNFIEFGPGDVVTVNPLRIRRHIINELEASTILFYTGVSRKSEVIIDDQVQNVATGGKPLSAMHEIRKLAFNLKAALLRGSIIELASGIKSSWEAKKATSRSIANTNIDEIEASIMNAGALSMKVSGAGGGGFIMIFVQPEKRHNVLDALRVLMGDIVNFEFTSDGVHSWTV